MKKEEYMGALRSALVGFDEELIQEIVADYEERFRVGTEKGKTEEQVIKELGSIKDLVDELGEMQQGAEETVKSRPKVTISVDGKPVSLQEIVIDTDERKERENTQGDDTNFEGRQSGTYYQEKTFAESFDSAVKKFGKALDGVMKEAGRVLEEAAAQFEMHMEEAKKNKSYTYYGDGTYEGSEKESDAEPNVEQNGQGAEGCRRVVVEADIADVTIRSSKESLPKAVCHYYSHKTAMLYPFYAYQEGDTFYVGVRRNQDTEKKSGFFRFGMSPSIEIELTLPEGVTLIEANSSSGSMELTEIKTEELRLRSKSGDVSASYITGSRCSMEAMSGDLELTKSEIKAVELATKSGDCAVDRLEAGTLAVNTASGDADVKSVQAVSLAVNTMSGDLAADAVKGQTARFHTASGEIDLKDCGGELIEAASASGDVSIQADYKEYNVKSQSGDVTLESRHDADVTAQTTSGDVEIRIIEALETYEVTMHSVSGSCDTMGRTKSNADIPSKTITAKAISGNIRIRFL